MFYKQLFLVKLYLILFSMSLSNAQYLQNLDKTYQILPEHVQIFSLARGAILYETKWLYNVYRFANFYPQDYKDRQGRRVIGVDPIKTDPLLQVVYKLFHCIADSISPTDFSSTNLIKTTDPFEIAQLGARIVVDFTPLKKCIEDLKSTRSKIKKNITILSDDKIKAIMMSRDFNKITATIQSIGSSRSSIFADKKFDLLKENLRDYKNSIESFKTIQKPYEKLLNFEKKSDLRISCTEFVYLVGKSLINRSTSQLFSDSLMLEVWLAFLYKTLQKTSESVEQNRKALCAYYAALAKLLDRKIELPSTSSLPITLDSQQALIEFSNLLAQKNSPLDSLLFYAMSTSPFPALEDYRRIPCAFITNKNSQNLLWSDCTENAIFNFIRIVSYDNLIQKCTVHQLEENLALSLSAASKILLQPFFEHPYDHTVCAKILSNIVGMPYKEDTVNYNLREKVMVKLYDNRYKDDFQKAGYTVVDNQVDVFELKASLRTIILALNYLLDLQLFDKDQLVETLRPDFLACYFPKFLDKLHLKGNYSKELTSDYTDYEGDILDSDQAQPLYTMLTSNLRDADNSKTIQGMHLFETKLGHATYDFIYEKNLFKNLSISSPTQDAKEYILLTILANYIVNNDVKQPLQVGLINDSSIYALALYNELYCNQLITELKNNKIVVANKTKLLFNLLKNRINFYQRNQLLTIVLNNSDNLDDSNLIINKLLHDFTKDITYEDINENVNVLSSLISNEKIPNIDLFMKDVNATLLKVSGLASNQLGRVVVELLKKYPTKISAYVTSFIKPNLVENAYSAQICDVISLFLNDSIIQPSEAVTLMQQAIYPSSSLLALLDNLLQQNDTISHDEVNRIEKISIHILQAYADMAFPSSYSVTYQALLEKALEFIHKAYINEALRVKILKTIIAYIQHLYISDHDHAIAIFQQLEGSIEYYITNHELTESIVDVLNDLMLWLDKNHLLSLSSRDFLDKYKDLLLQKYPTSNLITSINETQNNRPVVIPKKHKKKHSF